MDRPVPSSPGSRPVGKRLPAPERRRQILRAARRVFVDQGFSGARVADISQEAGVNEAILYRHFASKDEIFEAAVAEPLRDQVEVLLGMGDYAAEALAGSQTEYVTQLLDAVLVAVKDLAPLLGAVVFGGGELGREFYAQRVMPAIDECAAAIKAHDGDWDHRDFSPRLVVLLAVGACLMLAVEERVTGEMADADVTRDLANLLQSALGPVHPR